MREEWTEARIDELGNGRRPVLKAGPFGSSVTKATYKTSGYKVYGQQEVVAKDPNAEAYFVSEATFTRHKSCAVKPGDILMTMMGTIGRVYRVPEGAPEGIINPRLVRLAFDTSRILSEYAEVALEQPSLQRLLDRRSHGGTMQGLNLEALASIRLLLPPLPEQRKIVEILRTWNTAIETAEHLIAAKERRHRWLVQRLIDRRTARLHWETQELGSLIFERNERSSQHDEFPVLTSSRRGLFLQSEYFSKQVTSEDNTGYKIMRRGDFTFRSMSDDGRFVFNRLEQYDAGIISPAYGVFYADGVSPEFLAHYLNSNYFAQLLARETQGGTRKALRFSALASMEVELPKRADQERIAAILDESRREIDLLQNQLETLRRQKRGLMQKLLTGKWRVPLPSAESSFQETAPC